jgi:hypothetical protein
MGSEGRTGGEKGKFGICGFTLSHIIFGTQLSRKSRNTCTERIFCFYFSPLLYFGRQAHMSVWPITAFEPISGLS